MGCCFGDGRMVGVSWQRALGSLYLAAGGVTPLSLAGLWRSGLLESFSRDRGFVVRVASHAADMCILKCRSVLYIL